MPVPATINPGNHLSSGWGSPNSGVSIINAVSSGFAGITGYCLAKQVSTASIEAITAASQAVEHAAKIMAKAQEQTSKQMSEDIRTAALLCGVSTGILPFLAGYGRQILAHARK